MKPDNSQLRGAHALPEELLIVGLDDIPEVALPKVEDLRDDGERLDPALVLEGLIESIMANGVVSPVIVRSVCYGVDKMTIQVVINGRQRVMATREANRRLKAQGNRYPIRVPYIVREGDARHVVISNEHARRYTPLARARTAQQLLARGYTEAEVLACFQADDGTTISVATLRNWLSLLKLSPGDQKKLLAGELKKTDAYAKGKDPSAPPKAPRPPAPTKGQIERAAKIFEESDGDEPMTAEEALAGAVLRWVTTGDASDIPPALRTHFERVTRKATKTPKHTNGLAPRIM